MAILDAVTTGSTVTSIPDPSVTDGTCVTELVSAVCFVVGIPVVIISSVIVSTIPDPLRIGCCSVVMDSVTDSAFDVKTSIKPSSVVGDVVRETGLAFVKS